MEADPFELDMRTAADLDKLWQAVSDGRSTNIGFPGATDIDYSPLARFFTTLFNNVGDPWSDPAGEAHTKRFEREVLDWFGRLFDVPEGEHWGYVTSGGTEGNLAALHSARNRHPRAVAYYSAAAHYSISKSLQVLGIPAVEVAADVHGEMDYHDLSRLVAQHRHLPAIVIATAGTTVTEAIDDTDRIDAVLRSHGVLRRHLHVDGALAGLPLALDGRLRLAAPVDSIAISGHKFLATPIPCGLVLTRGGGRQHGRLIQYTATLDTTITGSRCGQAALLLWYAIQRFGREGLHARAQRARELAAYATDRLNGVGWPAWRHEHAFTVVFPTPPGLSERWTLSTTDGVSHIICMPGISRRQIDAFVADIAVAMRAARPRALPRQRIGSTALGARQSA
jgi:histidine decarboxylase